MTESAAVEEVVALGIAGSVAVFAFFFRTISTTNPAARISSAIPSTGR